MIYQILADVTVVLHLLFIVFVVIGAFAVLRWPRLIWIHLPFVVWAIMIEFFTWTCPLTPLENWLRIQGGTEGYSTSFTEHYILPVIYPATLTYGLQVALGTFVLIVNVAVYWRFVSRRQQRT
jgi:hypothetical protein